LSFIGALCCYYALLHMGLATANVVFYSAPLVTLVLAALWLKQTIQTYQVVQIGLGFLGVLVAMQPDEFHWAVLLAGAVAIAIALYNLLSCKLPNGQTIPSMVWWSTLSVLPVTLTMAVLLWQPISLAVFGLATVLAITTTVYQMIATHAYRSSQAGAITLAEYSGLLFALIFGVSVFGEKVRWCTLVGIMLIVLPMGWHSIDLFRKNQVS
jgi:drug/metabolite transporter (DMT)-like permease